MTFNFVTKHLVGSKDFLDLLKQHDVGLEHIGIVENTITFEKLGYMIDIDRMDKVTPQDRVKLVKIGKGDEIRELISINGSIMNILSQYQICMANLYALVNKGSKQETGLKEGIERIVRKNCQD
ncbi:MAG: hypothetical protein HRF51_04115 [bacterium]